MAREEKSGVEKLKNRLYARGGIKKIKKEERTALTPSDASAPKTWKEPEPPTPVTPTSSPIQTPPPDVASVSPREPRSHMSFALKFLAGSLIFFVLATGVASYVFFGGV